MHDIFGERFYARRQPAWHGLGKTFGQDEKMTLPNALVAAKGDFKVHKLPLVVNTPDGTQATVQGKIAIMREPTEDDNVWQYFGTAGENYGLIQNTELCKIFDPLAEMWPVETIGVLGKGKSLFFTLAVGGATVGGEAVERYFLVNDVKDGGTKLSVLFTPVRVVCQNTLSMALKQATTQVALQHFSGVGAELDFRVKLIKQLTRSMDDSMKVLETMAKKQLTKTEVLDIFAAAHPHPNRPSTAALITDDLTPMEVAELGEDNVARAMSANEAWLGAVARANGRRDACSELFSKINDEHSQISGTAWAAYNAVVEVADYRRANDEDAASADSLFGLRLLEKRRAFQRTMEYVR